MSLFATYHPKTFLQKIKDIFLPPCGYKRAFKYLGYRIMRLKASPYSLAAGFANGVAISFTPLLGGHLALAWFLSWILRGNYAAASFGTLIGMPWTLPFMWYLVYKTGESIIHFLGKDFPHMAFSKDIFAPTSFSVSDLFHSPEALLWPMFIGILPICLTAWFLVFFIVYFSKKAYDSKISLFKKARF